MSQIKPSHLLISLVMTLALVGCGDKNSKAVFSQESGHPANWVRIHNAAAQAGIESCSNCHGADYSGGISQVSCMSVTPVSGFTCHVTSPAQNLTGCVSCHGGAPNGPFGNSAPNRKFAHTKHTSLVGCDTCHLNAGSGTAGHAAASSTGGRNSATVALSPVFKAFSTSTSAPSAFGYNAAAGTCSSVSCHGGQVAPSFLTGSIVISAGDNSSCLLCHVQGTSAGLPQYNSFFSGQHAFHLGTFVNASCTNCHNIGALIDFQQHFGGIATNTLTTAMAQQTIGGASTKIITYTVTPTETCTATCHASSGTPQPWN